MKSTVCAWAPVKLVSATRGAVTNVPIPLEELKYWSVELQEAYSTPEAVLQRHYPGRLRLA